MSLIMYFNPIALAPSSSSNHEVGVTEATTNIQETGWAVHWVCIQLNVIEVILRMHQAFYNFHVWWIRVVAISIVCFIRTSSSLCLNTGINLVVASCSSLLRVLISHHNMVTTGLKEFTPSIYLPVYSESYLFRCISEFTGVLDERLHWRGIDHHWVVELLVCLWYLVTQSWSWSQVGPIALSIHHHVLFIL